MRLPDRHSQAHHERADRHRRSAHRQTVSARELDRAVAESVWKGGDRQASEVPAQVVAQRRRGRIAALRLSGQRLQHDVVEVARQAPAPACGVEACDPRDGRATNRDRGPLDDLSLQAPRPGRLASSAAVREAPGEQFEEQDTECVDVGRGGDRLAQDLLGSGVVRSHHALLGASGAVAGAPFEQLGDSEVE